MIEQPPLSVGSFQLIVIELYVVDNFAGRANPAGVSHAIIVVMSDSAPETLLKL